jgi:hypothetical protein
MAQTKTRKAKAAKKSPASSSKGKAKSPANGASANGAANGVGDGAKAVRDALGSAGKEAGQVVNKAKVPLLAGGAAVAGTVGGIVLGASRSGEKVLGVKLPKRKRVKIR